MKNSTTLLILIMLCGLPAFFYGQQPDTSKQALKDSQLAFKLYNESLGCFNDNKYPEAVSMATKAIALNPQFVKAYYNRGCYRLRMNLPEDAIADYSKVISLDPGGSGYKARGYVYLVKKEYQKAVEDLSVAVINDPESAGSYYYRACAYSLQEKNSQALADFDKAIELKPDYAIAYNDRGTLKMKMNELQSAKSDFTKAV
ncbi:MAG: tetratricopeptide repeat protein, partial [Bacteroidetes bacterium]|nr:tetratricopeptide repeat protein [Bacteroidota bacterium]